MSEKTNGNGAAEKQVGKTFDDFFKNIVFPTGFTKIERSTIRGMALAGWTEGQESLYAELADLRARCENAESAIDGEIAFIREYIEKNPKSKDSLDWKIAGLSRAKDFIKQAFEESEDKQ